MVVSRVLLLGPVVKKRIRKWRFQLLSKWPHFSLRPTMVLGRGSRRAGCAVRGVGSGRRPRGENVRTLDKAFRAKSRARKGFG
jgi:hypothetical protein